MTTNISQSMEVEGSKSKRKGAKGVGGNFGKYRLVQKEEASDLV